MDMLKKESKKRGREEMDSKSTGQATAAIEHRSFARIGFLGNPSDVYFGRTISFTIGNFWASVKLEPSQHLVIKPHPFHDLVQFTSLDHLVRFLSNLLLSLSGLDLELLYIHCYDLGGCSSPDSRFGPHIICLISLNCETV